MKIILKASFLITLLLQLSCNKTAVPQDNPILKNEHKENITIEEKKPNAVTDTYTQEDFNDFFRLFNKDSDFQSSRIKFPLKVKINNDDFELVDYVIHKKEYSTINLVKKPEERDYKQQIILKKDTVVIEQRGINNGIFIDYYFKRVNGKWQLATWVDVST
ncbi:DUF4348 domain-containing protein [Flavobacterium branchiarum]|uniref:DUF4348 domain-containing protein n=1 Tax=Flavobacterium branchiarum TaxID=1114870 RepID=A0ABV5FRW6_9FLAO|nr:DUF4348 domain-containing protein [Flavobacterium branchiarum]MDN3673353.1 DUF4348 domain-containing protein [Flavobacterium branchiarum]